MMRTKELVVLLVGVIFLLAGCVMHVPAGGVVRTETEIEVEASGEMPTETPPPIALAAPPEAVVIPGTYAYFFPDVPVDLFFYGGYWYRPYGGFWFRAYAWDGSWIFISTPPVVFLGLPVGYRTIFIGYPRIHYRNFHQNWYRWERERHWHRDSHWNRHQDRIRKIPRHRFDGPSQRRRYDPRDYRNAPPLNDRRQRQNHPPRLRETPQKQKKFPARTNGGRK